MRSVGVKILKNKLSEYLRLAANGETVLVTDRDRVVAERGPPDALWETPLASSRLLEYELWVRLNAWGRGTTHGDAARRMDIPVAAL